MITTERLCNYQQQQQKQYRVTMMWVFSGYFSDFILSNASTEKWVSLHKVTRDLSNKSVNTFDDYSSDSNIYSLVQDASQHNASQFSKPIIEY